MLAWSCAISRAQILKYSMRLLITRPNEDAQPLAQSLKNRGHKTIIEALMTINDTVVPNLKLTEVQALLITSANGIRALARTHGNRNIAVCAVGDASAKAARDLGFKKVSSAAGDVKTLAMMVKKNLDPADGALLHVAGSHRAGDLAKILTDANFEIRRTVIYEAQEVMALGPLATDALQNNTIDGVLFFSPRTADLFCRLVTNAKLSQKCSLLTAYCLSNAVVNAATALPWANVMVAEAPNSQALLDTVEQTVGSMLQPNKNNT